jgi:hypothetical protein
MSVTDHPAYKALKEKQEFDKELQALKARLVEKEDTATMTEHFYNTVYRYFEVNADILIEKHHDYGPTNISNAPGGALNGLRVRMHDKLARINNLIDSGNEPKNESLRDSFVDLANYAMIALLVMDKEWPNE